MIDKNEVVSALRAIFRDGDVFEVRILDAATVTVRHPHTVSGYYDYEHIDQVAEDIGKIVRDYRGVYYTPNPVNPALLGRAANRLRDCTGKSDLTTNDKDIPARRWLLIDCDAIRPSGISSSEEEHDAAREKADEIRAGLASMGFPAPLLIDSGNGAQLMYRIDISADDGKLIESILKQLQACNSQAVNVDGTVFNPARIWRLPGSMNCKGDNIPGRPHRQAHIVSRPDTLEVVPVELLRTAAGIVDTPEPVTVPERTPAPANFPSVELPEPEYMEVREEFELDSWIRQYCPDAEGPEPWRDARKWIFPVCPFNGEHRNRSAIITQQANGAIGFLCHHDGCRGNDWSKLRELKEPGYLERKVERENAKRAKLAASQPLPVANVVKTEECEPEVAPEPTPWRDVTTDDIRGAIDGTLLGEMAALYSSVTVPPLPLEAALLKAIVTAGCALSGQGAPETAKPEFPPMGARAARLQINTAAGQVCNVYAVLAANSASGKDIGNLLDTVTTSHGWNIGTSGSAEGIAEALKVCPNGLISISEFVNWLDEKHWQHKATSFLTEAFSKGFFRHNFSSRSGKGGISECDYCYPNIIANIQPEVFENVVRKQDIASGFMGRFIYCRMPEFFGDPARINAKLIIERFNEILKAFTRKHGVVEVPEGYGRDLSGIFKQYSPEKLHPSWRRLVNEYMPRFAVMLSLNHSAQSQGDFVMLEDKHWRAAELMVKYFFGHAENMLMQVEDETQSSRIQEKVMRRIVRIIQRYDKGDGITTKIISRNANHTGTNAQQRREILREMVERGIVSTTEENFSDGAKYRIKNLPPGW